MIKKVILKIKSGSSLYGTRTPQSDTDYIGVFIPQDDYIVGLQHIEQVEENVVDKINGKNTKDAVDCTYYELRRFLSLCLQGNPNVVEVLFVNEENIVEITEEGRSLLELKNAFLSEKLINNTYGYIKSMLKKLDTRQSTLDSLTTLIDRIKSSDIPYTEPIAKIEDNIKDLVKIDKYQYSIGKYHIQRNGTINNALKQLTDIYSSFTNRKELYSKYGYDTKSAHHIARLYYQIKELLAEQKVNYPLKYSKKLIEIKTGKIDYDEFMILNEYLRTECEMLEKESSLPKKPNFNLVNNWCKQVLIKNLQKD